MGTTRLKISVFSSYTLLALCLPMPISIVGKLISKLAVPASLTSTPKIRIRVGIISSPPATPSILLISPMTKPSSKASMTFWYVAVKAISPDVKGMKLSNISSVPIHIRKTSIILFSSFSDTFEDRSAPKKAPVIDPAIMDIIISSRGVSVLTLTFPILKINDDITVIKLIRIFKAIAFLGPYLNIPTNAGSLNSAPPSPISPPSVPIGTPVNRVSSVFLVLFILSNLHLIFFK